MKAILLGFIFLLSCSSSPKPKKADETVVPKYKVGTCFFKGGVQIKITDIKKGNYFIEVDLPLGTQRDTIPFKQAEKKVKDENLEQKACK